MSALDPQRISGWRKGIFRNASIAGELIRGFGVLSSPLPYLPLLTLPTASGKQKNNLSKGDRIFFGPTRTKLTMLPSHSAFSADHNSRGRDICASSFKLRQPQGFFRLLLYTNHTGLWKRRETSSHFLFRPVLSALKVLTMPRMSFVFHHGN